MPSTQKSLVLDHTFGTYTVQEKPIPTPAADQILVKVKAAALNPADWRIQDPNHNIFAEAYPIVLGWDGAGVVEEVGSDVKGFAKGDRVVFQGWYDEDAKVFHGTFQEYTVVPHDDIAKIPDDLSWPAASTIFSNICTSAVTLYAQQPGVFSVGLTPPWEAGGAGKQAGKSILIIGGAANAGQFAIQFAKWGGFSKIIATASLRNTDFVKSYGATHVIDRTLPKEKIIEQVKAIAGDTVDVAFEAISDPETIGMCIDLLPPGGSVVVTLPDQPEIPALSERATAKGAKLVPARGTITLPFNRGALATLFPLIPDLLQQGVLKSVPFEVLPGGLTGVSDGMQRLINHGVSATKLVVLTEDTP
ncbi:GroES-like protein [Earliella scabrosa]|nr:GroES-like protein [Earliella scabrosa]